MSDVHSSRRPIPSRYRDPATNESARLRLMRIALHLPPPTNEHISRFRDTLYDGDPLADAVAVSFAKLPRGEGHRLLAQALEQGIDSIPSAPQPLIDLFKQVDVRPAWLNDGLLERASRITERIGMSGQRVLSCVCLTGGYRSSAANKPLMFTGALESMAYRRLAETSKFVFDLYNSRKIGRDSAGFRAAVKVRVLHALVRTRLDVDPQWRHEEWGSPVNQADMLATNLLFSTVFVLGLRVLGHLIPKRDADALIHFWRYAGYLMGIRLELLPIDFDEACQLVYLSATTQPPGDEDSRKLAAALLSVPSSHDLSPRLRQVDIYWRAGFSRLMLGEREGDELGLPNHPLRWLVLPSVVWNVSTEVARVLIPGVEKLIVRYRRERVERYVTQSLEGLEPAYHPYARRSAATNDGGHSRPPVPPAGIAP